MTAKVWLSWPTPRKVRKRTWQSQKGSSPSCQDPIRWMKQSESWWPLTWCMNTDRMMVMLPLPSRRTECYQWRGWRSAPTRLCLLSSWCFLLLGLTPPYLSHKHTNNFKLLSFWCWLTWWHLVVTIICPGKDDLGLAWDMTKITCLLFTDESNIDVFRCNRSPTHRSGHRQVTDVLDLELLYLLPNRIQKLH